jgi:hypothetical protein
MKKEGNFIALYLLHGPTGVVGYSNTKKTPIVTCPIFTKKLLDQLKVK